MKSRFLKYWLVAVMLTRFCSMGAATTTSERVVVVDTCEYPSDEAARAAWKPVEDQTPSIGRTVKDGRQHLALPLNFQSNTTWRVAWDHAGLWDLSSCQIIRIHIGVENDHPEAMLIYFHTGDGWYAATFAAVPDQDFIDIPRRKFGIEGQPGGWDRVDCIRIAVRHEDNAERQVVLSGIEGLIRPANVVVYRNDSGVKAESSIADQVNRMGTALERLAIAYEIVGDEEVLAGKLDGKQVAILPLNPVLSKALGERLTQFVAGGGRLIVCYRIPAPLDALLGVRAAKTLSDRGKLHAFTFEPLDERTSITVIQRSWIATGIELEGDTKVRAVWANHDGILSTDAAVTSNRNGFYLGHVLTSIDPEQKDLLLREMIGELWPGLWKEICDARFAGLAKIAGFKDEKEVRQAIAINRTSSGRQAAIDEQLNEANQRESEAKTALLNTNNLAHAADALAVAQCALMRAYATSIPSKTNEFRAVWCHSATGVEGMTWDAAIKRLADSGFNAIMPNMCWGNSAAYESKVLQRATGIKGDQLAECLAAAKKYGVAVHVWRVCWNLFWRAEPQEVARLRAADRLQVDSEGKPVAWLCPSNPDNQQLEVDATLEIVKNYDVAGVHFDYIRYPNHSACFCLGCRKRFEDRAGVTLTNWPVDATTGAYQEAYRQFRRDNITQLVATVSKEVRKVRPGVQISAAVFPYWLTARDDVGQDWKLWIEKGYLDFVCPMQYTDSGSLFEHETKRSAQWVGGKVPLRPGIGATLGLAPDGTLQQVLSTRMQANGFVLFNYDRALFEHLDLLKLGATRK